MTKQHMLRSVLIATVVSTLSVAETVDEYVARRATMVERHIRGAGVSNERVIESMLKAPRHELVPANVRRRAYYDMALPIGNGQTISSPYIVALMTARIDPQPDDRVLEIGTGSGYQAAVLSPLVREVYTIEIVPDLGHRAEQALKRMNYANVHVRVGDGYKGWSEHAPFDKIIVTCSPEDIPQPLVDQLAEGGHLVIPVGERFQQNLYRFTKVDGQLKRERLEATFFVPMTGQAEAERQQKPQSSTPQLVNGSFEHQVEETQEPLNWYYVRRAKVTRDPASPHGDHCLRVQKSDVADVAHALQSFGIDGRRTKKLSVSLMSRGKGISAGLFTIEQSQVILEFYGEDRERLRQVTIPVAPGSFDWQHGNATFDVPESARLAVIGVGLFGARGEIYLDDVKIEAVE